MTEHSARNGDERYVFTGTKLGHSVSSTRPTRSRWTEITIWRTAAGKYVFEKVGRSVVYHTTDERRWVAERCMDRAGAPFGRLQGLDGLNSDSRACPFCKPVNTDAPEVRIETDRFFAVVTDNAPALVEACRLTDNDPDSDSFGTMFHPEVARRALTMAGDRDEGIRDAFLTQRIA